MICPVPFLAKVRPYALPSDAARWARISLATADCLQYSAQPSASRGTCRRGCSVSAPASSNSRAMSIYAALDRHVQRGVIAVADRRLALTSTPCAISQRMAARFFLSTARCSAIISRPSGPSRAGSSRQHRLARRHSARGQPPQQVERAAGRQERRHNGLIGISCAARSRCGAAPVEIARRSRRRRARAGARPSPAGSQPPHDAAASAVLVAAHAPAQQRRIGGDHGPHDGRRDRARRRLKIEPAP